MAEISVNDLKKTFGNITAVDIPELKIEKGDFLGLVGNNGAGKTTFFRLLLDLAKPDNGNVTLAGVNPALSEKWKMFTGAYLDEGFLIDFLTPAEFFEFLAKVNGIGDIKTVLESLNDFIVDIVDTPKYIRELSAGNKQKVGICAAMLNRPEVLILDEPFNYLDPKSQEELKVLLNNYHISTGASVLLSSHNLQHVAEISTRIIIMDNGRIVRDLDNSKGSAGEQLESYFKV